jgi:[FeFe] hydrogenase H-cluster maturation GTPase HydF
VHLALFGKRNAGKSSLINALTGQETAIVSEVKGTTTDPVFKAMEILPIGPCVLIDTAGTDDAGELGQQRIKKTLEVLEKTDVALLVIDITEGINEEDRLLLKQIKDKNKPLLLVLNKADQIEPEPGRRLAAKLQEEMQIPTVLVSALEKQGIQELKEKLISLIPEGEDKFRLVGDLISPGDLIVLVTPIDRAAPKGRLILPQQQVIRDILESDATALVTKEFELRETLTSLAKKPKLVITDSQVFLKVAADTPKDILLTSFSILFARQKGDLAELIQGTKAIDKLKDGDKVLIAEGCTHHRQSDDIGTVKIPRWLRQRTGKQLEFEFSSGTTFSEDIRKYALIVHCGACMLNRSGMLSRLDYSKEHNVPMVNYGLLIAYVQGILPRALEPFPLAKLIWDEEYAKECCM